MTTTRNAEKLRQDKRMFYLIVEQILAVTSSTNWVKKLRIYLQIWKDLHNSVLRYR